MPSRTSQNGVQPPGANTIRILVATDNHVGYNERDAIRGDDSWRTFDEIMKLAVTQDVDMVLLAGDLFHDNKPSRKALFQVMRSLRENCYGAKPCELEMLSDGSEAFAGQFNHVNYEDANINVAIPVFSIHGNHDDPSGEGHYASLDILQVSGLVNYYGRTPESDNIEIKPVLLQKGQTKLALYGMSNVRDERLFRTFRDGKVKVYQPTTQKENWFNLMSVHQNHHAYSESGYLPENFLPEFMDLVVWGHEHECLIEPRHNPEMNFKVMQPGSSVATSLMPGEAVDKHVAILDITGKDFSCKPIRLKSVRPFIMREIVLQEERGMKTVARKENNRTEITNHLQGIVEELIEEAKSKWLEVQDSEEVDEDTEIPLPLIRLRVEFTAPDGGKYDMENPQRFSNRFLGRVANVNDVVQYHRKKTTTTRRTKDEPEMPDASALAQITLDTVKVEKLVREFLTAQQLTFLPQGPFGDAVSQFVDKDDKYVMEQFVEGNLVDGIKHLLDPKKKNGQPQNDDEDEDDLLDNMAEHKSHLEELFEAGTYKKSGKTKIKPKPAHWDSDLDGHWADNAAAVIRSDADDKDDDDDDEEGSVPPVKASARGRGKAATSTRGAKKATRGRATATKSTRGKKKVVEEDDDDEDEVESDVVMLDDDDEEDEPSPRKTTKTASKTTAKAPGKKAPARTTARAASGRQTQLNFGASQSQAPSQRSTAARNGSARAVQEISDDDISDDDDAFAPAAAIARSRRR